MTKEDIKKALTCCSNPSISYCKDCPYANYGEFDCCNGKMCKDALNLITEQEKEIERVNKKLSEKEEYHRMTQALCHSYRNDYWKTFQRLEEQQQENERLKAENDTNMQYIRMMGIQNHIKTSNERVKQAKIDVLNELKEKCKFDGHTVAVYKNDIDDMIKELQNEQ